MILIANQLHLRYKAKRGIKLSVVKVYTGIYLVPTTDKFFFNISAV